MQNRDSIRRQLVVAGVMVAILMCGRARGQILNQVPADALAVLKIKNMEAVSKKAAKMAKGLGLDQLSPEWGDPLGALEDKTHLGKGVDKSGDLALVFMDPEKFGGDSDKAMIALIPIENYKAFLGSFKATEADGDLIKATPVEGDEVYLAHWGNYAAMSPSKSLLEQKPKGLKLEGLAAKEWESKDAIVYANMIALRAKALPEIKKSREQMVTQFETQFGQTGGEAIKKFMPVIRVVINEYMDAVEEFMNDARAATLGMSLGDEGVSTTIEADFEPDSYIGKLAGEVKNTDKPLLAGLPNRKYFFLAGSVNEPEASGKLMSKILDPIKAELAKIDEARKFAPALDALEKSAKSTTGVAMGWVAPTGALGAESVVQQVQVIHGDAKAVHQAQRETMEAMSDLIKSLPQQKDSSMKIEFKPDAKTVDDVQLDTYETKMEFSEDSPQGAQAKQIMSWVYGPNGNSGVLGEVNPKTLLFVQGGSDQLVSDSIVAAKANTDVVSDMAALKAVARELPKERASVGYLDLGVMVGTGIRYAKGLGLPVNVKLQPNLPPIGMTGGSEGSAIRVDVFIPDALIQGLVAAGMQAQQQMKNGPGGGL